VMRRAT